MTYPAPEQHMRDYLDAALRDGLQIADIYDGNELQIADLRDVLNELDSYRTRVEELDSLDPFAAKLSSTEDRATMAAQIVLAKPGTVTETDRRNAAVRLAELVLGLTDENGQ